MQRHLLLTVSDSPSSMDGARFVSSFFRDKSRVRLTLVHVAPARGRDPGFGEREPTEKECKLLENEALRNAARFLEDSGFSPERTRCQYRLKAMSTAKDILREAERGKYDAVVLGRRGTTRLEEALGSSVSMQVLEKERNVPIWICRRIESGRGGVLLCLDGSDSSLVMADHVGFMLQGPEEHGVTLFHVPGKDSDASGEIFSRAREALLQNGLDASRISDKEGTGRNVAKAIQKEAKEGGYAAVAVGYSGTGKQGLRSQWSIGSVSKKLSYELQGHSLWIS
ncbi:MAG: universal stress protein [Desulfohalobiaceae bacterium]|nr:universal stress protein [Desulfohalobiaceae bacterium]MCF8086327.1 universal stress protein [Desulfohalobiaceae bacterium]